MNEAHNELTVEVFRDALAKGLGRTLQTLRRTDTSPYHGAILDACLTVERHSLWMEPDPGPYLMEHVRLAGMEREVLDAVLLHFNEEAPSTSAFTSRACWKNARGQARSGLGKRSSTTPFKATRLRGPLWKPLDHEG